MRERVRIRALSRAWVRIAVLVAVVATVLPAFVVPSTGTAGAAETPGLDEARSRAQAATRAINDLETQLGGIEDDLAALRDQRDEAEHQLDGLRVRVRELAIDRYTQIGTEPMPLPGTDINAQGRAEAMARIVTQTNSDAIDEYRATKDRLERASAELEDKQGEQAAKLDELHAQRDRLDAELAVLEQAEAERLAAELRAAEEAARAAADARARDDAARQAQQLAGLQEATRAGKSGGIGTTTPPSGGPVESPPPPVASGGPFVCPVQGPRSFVDSWGAARPGGRAHQGVDIMSPRGTPVVTPVSGHVRIGDNGLGGHSFYLDGGDGNFYYGAHMDSYSGAQGNLPAGTVVGYVGDTGDAKGKGTHLHFEIHIGGYGHPVDPYPTVARYC